MRANFNGFELNITKEEARRASHPGPCDAEVSELADTPRVKLQLDKINPKSIRSELDEYGAWDDAALADDAQNRLRILWIACGDIRDRLVR